MLSAGARNGGGTVAERRCNAGGQGAGIGGIPGPHGAIVEGSHSGADDHPDLAWHAKGQALQHADDLLDGTQATGRPVLSPEVASVDTAAEPPTVVVKDCADTSDWQIADEDLEELGPLPDADGPRPITATVTEEGGAWQVAKLVFGEYGACER